MSFLHRVVRIVVFVAMTVLGVALIAGSFSDRAWASSIALVQAERLRTLCVGVAFLSLSFLFLLTGIPRKRRARYLSFENEGGTVSISTEAIANYVAKLASEFPSVLKMRPQIIPVRDSIDIFIDVRVKASPQIHEACQAIQQRVRESLVNGLGITDVGRIEVSVREIASEHKPI